MLQYSASAQRDAQIADDSLLIPCGNRRGQCHTTRHHTNEIAPPHMNPPESVQHLIGSNLHFNRGCRGLTELAAMSALGHKRTCAAQKVMSALPPIVDVRECDRLASPKIRCNARTFPERNLFLAGSTAAQPPRFVCIARGSALPRKRTSAELI